MAIGEAIGTELPNIKDCKNIDIGYSYAYKTDCAGDRYIKAEEVKYLLKCERNKAVEDVCKAIEEECSYDADMNDDCYFEISRTTLLHLAEQLRAGGGNGA